MSKKKPRKETDWIDEADLTDEGALVPDWDPESFQEDEAEDAAFENWDLTLDEKLVSPPLIKESTFENETPFELDDWTEDDETQELLDTLVVLAWETVGVVEPSGLTIPVRLDPSLSRSQWRAPERPPILTCVLRVQGVRFEIDFEYVDGVEERLVLGREALEDRVLISVPKAH
jgi:hypothetical protein